MINLGRFNILGIQVNAIDYDSTVTQIICAAQQHSPFSVSALAVHGVMTGVLDAEHGYRLNHLDLVVPDGQPVRWALNGLYQTGLGDRVYGPTLMLRLCDRAAQTKLPIYLYGSRPEVLEALQNRLQKKFPALVIAGTKPSQFRQISDVEQDTVLKSIRDSGARIVFVGLGCPRQEIWAYEVRDRLGIPAIAVGAAFDFHAGLLPQAPTWMQRSGLEWLFRLIQEPKRLWQRYLVFNSLYVLGFTLQYLRLKAFQPSTTAPEQPCNYS